MEYLLQFAYQSLIYVLLPIIAIVAWWRWKFYKQVRYRYALAGSLNSYGISGYNYHKRVFFLLRLLTLVLMVFLLAKPRFVDPRSHAKVEGIDIVVVLDVSGSMSYPHHSDDNRTRIDVAKEEAIRFVDKRTNDAIGLVIFGNHALSRCPLTVDKQMLKDAIAELQIGIVDHNGTVLSQAIITAANRLKTSKAKSKVMIVLTDGAPSENDVDPKVAIEVAKKLGLKIYTIGIGDQQPIYVQHPFYGKIPISSSLNKPLLTQIADETGGRFFEAKSARDMRTVYETIDTLEKTEIEAPLFSNYYEWFMPLLVVTIACMCLEIILTSFVWFGI